MTGPACVAIVTDERYRPGTIVAATSFLRHNPWFSGPIVLIHDDADWPGPVEAGIPDLRLRRVSTELRARVAAIVSKHPHLVPKVPIFFALEAFNLTGFDRVLALDSDVVCVGDASEVFALDGAVLACPDQAYFWGKVRDRTTYMPRTAATPTAGETRPDAFNAGIVALSPPKLGGAVFHELLERISDAPWAQIRTGHTVSVILNEYFRDRWTPLPEKYNYLISNGMTKYTRRRCSIDEAVFLHLLGRPKPWQAVVEPVNEDHRRALDLWADAHHAWRRADPS